VVMPQDINDGLIQTASIARISETRAASLARHRLKTGDIIIARRGELSRAAAVGHTEIEWICGTGCFLLRLGRTELNHFFFSHVYRYDFIQRQVAGMQVGSTMPSLNNDVMRRLFFPCPSPTEQGEITRRLDLAESKIGVLQDELSKFKQQKSGLMHDLLTGKVSVEIENKTTAPEAVT
jgi:type I restriction enzyme, S subunit